MTQTELDELIREAEQWVSDLFEDHGPTDEPYKGAGYCSCRTCQADVPRIERLVAALRELREDSALYEKMCVGDLVCDEIRARDWRYSEFVQAMQGSAPTQVIEAVCEMLVTLRGPYVGRIDHDIASRLSRTFDIDAELWIRIDENFFGQAIDRARGAQQ